MLLVQQMSDRTMMTLVFHIALSIIHGFSGQKQFLLKTPWFVSLHMVSRRVCFGNDT